MRPSNMSLANALKALEEEQKIDIAKLESLRDSLVDGKAAIIDGGGVMATWLSILFAGAAILAVLALAWKAFRAVRDALEEDFNG